MPGPAWPAGVAVVLLAAGVSRRFGSPKQLHPWAGRPLVRHMAETALASRAARLVVVTGAYRAEVEAALAGLPLELVHNADFAAGQSSSVRRGLAAAQSGSGAEAILFLPVDMPLLESATLDRLIEAFVAAGDNEGNGGNGGPAAVVPTYGGRRGAPVLFARRLFGELDGLTGDQGGRALLPRHPREILEVAVAREIEGRDIDTPEDLRADPDG